MAANGTAFANINLSDFSVKEILGVNSERKSIFILLEKGDEKAVLVCDKHAFEENIPSVCKWLQSATLRLIEHNDRFGNFEMRLQPEHNEVKTAFIYPATDFDVAKYRSEEHFMLRETPDDYKNIVLPYLKESGHERHLTWVYNFLDKKAEEERILLENDNKRNGFLLAPDLKWNGTNLDELYVLAVVHRRDLKSVRELTPEELPLLENIRDQSAKFIKDKYGLERKQLKMYFHYQPTFYHLHVHIVALKYDAPGWGGTSILLDDVIDNIKIFPDYYQRATLPFVRKANHPMYLRFVEAGRV